MPQTQEWKTMLEEMERHQRRLADLEQQPNSRQLRAASRRSSLDLTSALAKWRLAGCRKDTP